MLKWWKNDESNKYPLVWGFIGGLLVAVIVFMPQIFKLIAGVR